MLDAYGYQRRRVTPALQIRFRKASAIITSRIVTQALETSYPAMLRRETRRKYATKDAAWVRMVRVSIWILLMRFTDSASKQCARSTATCSRSTKGLPEKMRTPYQ